MRVPDFLAIGNEMHALTRKLVRDIFISSVATLCATVVFSNFHAPAPRPAPQLTGEPSVDARFVKGQSSEATYDFVERVALSHVAGLRPPSASANAQPEIAASNEPAMSPASPPPLRQTAPPRRERSHGDKAHGAANPPKSAPAAQAALTAIEPAATPEPAGVDWLAPLHYGRVLAENVGNIVAASDARVLEGMASAGDAMITLSKKLHL